MAFIAGLIALTVGFCHNMTRAEAREGQAAECLPAAQRTAVGDPGVVDEPATWIRGVAPGR
ncbi:MAG TPA: hypothetical protein VMM93_14240 [Vicinamibacterales bacterium]|nr:hypothetical protein [Vicinamibacterales bacterium]